MFVPLPAEMTRWDARSTELGLPAAVLMENAAREALDALREHYGPLAGALVHLFMGGGNNGGDAACLARHLQSAGALPTVFHARQLTSLRGASRQYALLARRLGISFVPSRHYLSGGGAGAQSGETPDIIVDGLLGTGFRASAPMREEETRLAAAINSLRGRAFILALDVPSGLDAATGRAVPHAVRADLTVAFEAAKPGLLVPEAAPHVGRLAVRPIGMPARVKDDIPASYRLWRGATADPGTPYFPADAFALPPLPAAVPAHKGEAGRVLIMGGSVAYPGAPCLAAWGALRGGAGLVGAALPEPALAVLRAELPEAVAVPLAPVQGGAQWPPRVPDCARWDVVLAGPGMGRGNGAEEYLAALLAAPQRPSLVLDADALGVLADCPELLAYVRPTDVLTPHPGEAAALLGRLARDIQADRFAALGDLAALAPAVWVLKGAGTLIHTPGEATVICPFAVPQLAVAGSGDVLAGLLAALIAQGLPPGEAACRAVHHHALAGLLLAREFPHRGNTARDIAHALPRVAWSSTV